MISFFKKILGASPAESAFDFEGDSSFASDNEKSNEKDEVIDEKKQLVERIASLIRFAKHF
jgi:hypothetical protein